MPSVADIQKSSDSEDCCLDIAAQDCFLDEDAAGRAFRKVISSHTSPTTDYGQYHQGLGAIVLRPDQCMNLDSAYLIPGSSGPIQAHGLTTLGFWQFKPEHWTVLQQQGTLSRMTTAFPDVRKLHFNLCEFTDARMFEAVLMAFRLSTISMQLDLIKIVFANDTDQHHPELRRLKLVSLQLDLPPDTRVEFFVKWLYAGPVLNTLKFVNFVSIYEHPHGYPRDFEHLLTSMARGLERLKIGYEDGRTANLRGGLRVSQFPNLKGLDVIINARSPEKMGWIRTFLSDSTTCSGLQTVLIQIRLLNTDQIDSIPKLWTAIAKFLRPHAYGVDQKGQALSRLKRISISIRHDEESRLSGEIVEAKIRQRFGFLRACEEECGRILHVDSSIGSRT